MVSWPNTDPAPVRHHPEPSPAARDHAPLRVLKAADTADVPPSRETPLRRQFEALKADHPGAILLFQLGDFFESFEEDARTVARVCGVALTSREFGKGDRVALAGVPVVRVDAYLARLVEAGLRVAVAEQVSPPGSGLVKRSVTRVLTPGTVAEPGLLREKENGYLLAVYRGRAREGIGLASVDVSTGEFALTQLEPAEGEAVLQAELARLDPREVLVAESQRATFAFAAPTTIRPGWRFGAATAAERVCRQFGVASPAGVGCADLPLGVRAAGALLAYLEETNPRLLASVAAVRRVAPRADGMVLDAHTRRNLELVRSRSGHVQGSLLAVLDRTQTPMGGRLLRRWVGQPLLDTDRIVRRLDAVEALVRDATLRQAVGSSLAGLADVERLTARVAQGSASPRDLLALATSLEAAAGVLDLLEQRAPAGLTDGLWGAGQHLDACPDVRELIGRAMAPTEGERWIRPGFNHELDELVASVGHARRWIASLEQSERLRTGIRSLRVGFNRVFGYYLEVTRPNLHLVPRGYQRKQTLAGAERFVLPELRQCQARIEQAEARILAVAREVLDDVTRQVSAHGARLAALASALARLDALLSLAEAAVVGGYCRPEVDHGDQVQIRDGRHPVVEQFAERQSFIPNDCSLGASHGTLALITGPNMAGKSTYLRQVALIVLLAQVGSFVPAREARIGLVDRIFTRVGAQDDLAAGESTFMVEMAEAASILRGATARSLVILDEVGRGTSTFDGLAIARAIAEHLHDAVGARTLFATHYHELAGAVRSLSNVRLWHAAVAEEEGEVVFLRKIVPGVADRSFGIHVARLAGLPTSVTQRAAALLAQLELRRAQPAVAEMSAGALTHVPYGSTGGGGTPEISAAVSQVARAATREAAQEPARACSAIERELLALDLLNLTPLAALNTLADLQARLRRGPCRS